MSTDLFVAYSSPVSADREDEFNEWYTATHLPEVRREVPGIAAARRYRVLGSDAGGSVWRYVCIYELVGTDAASAAAALQAALQAGRFAWSSAMDTSRSAPEVHFLESIE